ncbi:MAG: tRNA dihydrouridine(20/20a) synthase DusA [Pseudomonadales bacterium]|jgi:tRNA-dihydrouridine synthase A|nr:tRNA dihydrouridine(20/20a) synthase DusA [Pseudomonadales bacterium]
MLKQASPFREKRFAVAPMLAWTDRHCRYFMRLLSRKAMLYTEMLTTGALLHGDCVRFLAHDPAELPLALQLGGSVPKELAASAALAEAAGFSEINLNVGCPSDRVQHHMIGACLMAHPALVGECVAALRERSTLPVTVKCRIGIDAMDSDEALFDFIGTVAERGCKTFIIHARIAILAGLSPKENRDIPPLNYPRVYRVKQHFPALEIIINGGITTLDACQAHLQQVDGVMLGREAYHNPWLLQQVDPQLFDLPAPVHSRAEALEAFLPYAERCLAAGVPLNHLSRHLLGLFHGQNGGKRFRRYLSERAHLSGANLGTLREALALTQDVEHYVP